MSARVFDREQRAERLVEICPAGGENPVAVHYNAPMLLKERRHGPAEAVAARSDFSGNDRCAARGSFFRTAEMAETPLRTVPLIAIEREDHRKRGMAVQDGLLSRVEHDLAVG